MKKGVILSFILILVFLLVGCNRGPGVTFDYMDLAKNVNVNAVDGVVEKPSDVSVDGYIFIGWFNEETFETPFDFDQTITERLTAYGYFVTEQAYMTQVLPMNHPSQDVYYEIFVRSFADSDDDGVGDLNGITDNLDYLESLGITALWLMPINPSPSYHGYDVTNYYGINSDYGTMADFENLISEANARGIDIIIDLVVNHTSDQHPWYQSAVSSESSPYRDWYIFPDGSNVGYETFVGGMKDLNYDHPDVQQEMKDILQFWIEKGVHGFRLDAVLYLYEYSSAHRTVDYDNALLIREWDTFIKTFNPDAYIVSEAWYGSYEDYATYYLGSESLFDFSARSEILTRLGTGTGTYLLIDKLVDMYDEYRIYNPEFMDALMIGNHDTDRIASISGFNSYNSLEKLKLAASIQMTLPGNPFIYYGDEIGTKGWRDYSQDGFNMPGYGIVYDEVRRVPFLWGSDDYQTSWYPDNQNDDTVDVDTQMANPDSLWSHYQDVITLRRVNPALMYGNTIMAYRENNNAIQGFIRVYEDDYYTQAVLVIHNVSPVEQTITLSGDYTILYGNTTMPMYSTLVVQINPDQIEDYS